MGFKKFITLKYKSYQLTWIIYGDLNVCIIPPHCALAHVYGVGPVALPLGHHEGRRRGRGSNLKLDLLNFLGLVQTSRESLRDGGISVRVKV